MAKINEIRAMAENHACEVSRSPRDWMGFLDTAARLYRYSFADNLLIHAQKPEATACAELEVWNKKMMRWVNRGAKGIALLDNWGARERLRYVFDVSDTHPVRGGREPNLWLMEPSYHKDVTDHLIDTYGLDEMNEGSLPAALRSVARMQVEENIEEAVYGLAEETEGTYLEEKDEAILRQEYTRLLTDSIFYTLLRRCGFEPLDYLEEEDFRGITDFNSLPVLTFLGNASSMLSEPVLRDIGRTVQKIYRENVEMALENSTINMYNTREQFNALIRESGSEQQISISENGGLDNGTDLSSQRGLPVSKPGSEADGADRDRQVRDASQNLPEGTPSELVSEPVAVREVEPSPVRNRPGGEREDGGADGTAGREVPGTRQSGRPTGMGSAYEQPDGDGGRDRLDGIGVQLTGDTTEQDLSEAEEETASALSLPELPTVNEQRRTLEERQAARYAGEIAIPSDVVDEILRQGSNRERGQLRLIYNFMAEKTPEEYTEFVKQEYRTGGRGIEVNGQEYSAWWDELGMQIAVSHTVADRVLDKAFLSWEDVSGRIQQLLEQGEYAPQVVLDAARANAVSEHAQALFFMERDLAEGVSELVFEDSSVFRGGYPDVVERLSGLLKQPEFLADLNERLEGLAAAYEEDPEIMRFRTYLPDKMSAQFQLFAKEAVPYHARDGFAWQEHKYFITQDEIDAFLTRGGPYDNGRLATYAYFIADHTDAQKTDFIKERYGTGGNSHALSGADDSNADYTAKGLTLARGSYGNPYASIFLTWPKVAQRVNHLIRMELFLKPADYSRMPEYEREQMARKVMAFYGRLPSEIPRPFNEDFFGEDARKQLTEILAEPAQAEKLLEKMDGVLAALPLDFDRYEERAQNLSELHQYVDGTYTIFPDKKQEAEQKPVSGRQMTLFDFMSVEDLQPEVEEEPDISAGVLDTSAGRSSEPDFAINPTNAANGAEPGEEADNPQVVARYQSTMEMQDGYIEDIAILQYPNGKFYNHYGFDEGLGMGAATAGPFDTLEEARGTVLAHRPDAQEIDLYEIDLAHSEPSDLPQSMSAKTYGEYLSIKGRYPDTLVGFEMEDHFEFFGDDALMVSDILGSKLLDKPVEGGDSVAVSGFPSGQWVYYSKKLWSQGENVYLSGEQEDGTHDTVKYLSGRDYLPIDATVHIDGGEFRIDSVDYNRGMVSLQDMTMAKEARYPIFREEPTGYVRSLYEEEEPQYDFATEETVFIAIQRSMYDYEDFSGEQMDVIYAAAEAGLNLKPLLNPEFTPGQMQLIVDVEARVAAGEKVAFDGAMLPLTGHVMTSDEINAVRREYHLPLDFFDSSREEPGQETGSGGAVGTGTETDGAAGQETNGQITSGQRTGMTGMRPTAPGQRPGTTPLQERINFHITDDDLGAGGAKTKFRANIDAIRLLKELEAESRLATAEEQEVLSRFVGWGGIPQAFDAKNESWASEYAEVRELLTTEEYREARASTLNAFYTSPAVIKAMYAALENMGLRSGNVLEPSCGVGNFMGLVPESMDGLKMYGVELDSISGRIAGQLYQKNKIAVRGFETVDFPESFFDCTIGNVPFGEYKVVDPKYDRYNFLIHDYFIAKSLDLVRPGGVVAVVTSSGTMDKQNESVRRYLANRADLLGAIRLPNNAFLMNANTGVVADILFLQKRDRAMLEEPEWVHLGKTSEGYTVNSYFAQHPEMVLGEFTTESTQYGKQEVTVKSIEGTVLVDQLSEAVSHIHGTITELELDDLELNEVDTSIPADPGVKNFSYANVDGQVYYRENSRMNLMELPKMTSERILGMIEIRNMTQELLSLQMEDCSDLELKAAQDKLNRQYDAFTAQYGLLNNNANRRAFSQDSSYCLLASLEIVNENGELERKADIFTKRTIRKPVPVTSVDTASEALAVSIGEKARVDVPFMAQLSRKTEDEVTQELAGIIFKNPLTEQWESSDEYLSGNVREKLSIARQFTENHPEYAINAEYLERVQPKNLDASEIEVRLGATWIKQEYIQQFMVDTFHTPWRLAGNTIAVHYAAVSGAWEVSGKTRDFGNPLVNSTYGTTRANAYRLLEDALNLRDTKIYDTVRDEEGKEHRVINKNETMLAQQKQELIKAEFKEWIFRDIDRREDLCQTYNTLFNSIRPREYDGSHIQFVGMTPEITLMQHQKNAVAHILYGGNTLLAHAVGAGKTFQMIAAGMESKRLGLAQKSLYVVPNHLTEQWGSDFLRLYPGANVLVATKKDFEPANRKKFCSRIATGNYDAVIIGHSQFERIPLSRERQIAGIEKQIDDITEAIEASKGEEGSRITVKQMEKTRKSLQARLERLNNQTRKDDVVTFEQLGVDRLFVDESHNYKNLFLYTKMRNVAGISQTDAQKSSDMFMKCQYMDEVTGSRGVTFATGTPISNSMTELYTNMRYLQYDTLQKMGLGHFDSWAASFGETVNGHRACTGGDGLPCENAVRPFL